MGLKIGGVEIRRGETKIVNLNVAKLYDYTEMTIPVRVIRGKTPGPVLFVSSAIHGDEINGIEIIRRVVSNTKLLRKINGTLIAVPIVNIFGFNSRSRHLPDGKDMNRMFPGSRNGSLASQLAHTFMEEIVSKCTHGIDLHTGSTQRPNLPQIRACLDDAETDRIAHAFGVPVVLNSALIPGSLRAAAREINVPVVVYEGGEALRFDEVAIKVAVNGVFSVMSAIGMLDGDSARIGRRSIRSHEAYSSYWVRARSSGVMKLSKKLGSSVKEGAVLGSISDPFGNGTVEIRAREAGIIIGQSNLPLVNRGDAIIHIASFEDIVSVKQTVDEFDDFIDGDIIGKE